jgi:limonene-1,2-epoxide hydrolase
LRVVAYQSVATGALASAENGLRPLTQAAIEKADILAFLRRSMSKSVAGIVYTLQRAYPDPKAGWTVLEISTRGRTASGHDYTNRLVGIFVYRSGRIVLFREYFNLAKIG